MISSDLPDSKVWLVRGARLPPPGHPDDLERPLLALWLGHPEPGANGLLGLDGAVPAPTHQPKRARKSELVTWRLLECQGLLVLLRTQDAQGPRELTFFQIGRIMNQLLFGGLPTISFSFQRETAIQTFQPFPPSKQHGECGLWSPPLPQPTAPL